MHTDSRYLIVSSSLISTRLPLQAINNSQTRPHTLSRQDRVHLRNYEVNIDLVSARHTLQVINNSQTSTHMLSRQDRIHLRGNKVKMLDEEQHHSTRLNTFLILVAKTKKVENHILRQQVKRKARSSPFARWKLSLHASGRIWSVYD